MPGGWDAGSTRRLRRKVPFLDRAMLTDMQRASSYSLMKYDINVIELTKYVMFPEVFKHRKFGAFVH
jgi:hypothetical protein